jgi:aryl-alcohol dehydrogenase-like predicted oxidoreductase
MPLARLGPSDLAITPVGLGAWAMGGGDWCLGWGPQSDADSIATVRRAIDLGLNWIDTSNVYGLGRSERVIGRALRSVAPADRPYVFTTCGFVWDDLGNVSYRLDPDSIRREAEASLRRLGVEAIDLYQIDAPAGPIRAEDSDAGPLSLESAWRTLVELQREGKVRAIGLANHTMDEVALVGGIAPVTAVQVPYSLLQRGAEADVLLDCTERGIGVIASSPLASGLLTGGMTPERLQWLPHNDWRRHSSCFRSVQARQARAVVAILERVGVRYGVGPGPVAIAWALRHRAIAGAAAGARRPDQIEELSAARTLRLTDAEIAEIEGTSRGAQETADGTRH